MRDKEILGLWEAYQYVHQPKEQMNEEVENWVNSLIDEGYDLSEYTWEDMYEIYISEERRDPRGRVASGPMSVYGGQGQDAGPGGSGNNNVDRMDAAQRRVKKTQPKEKGMAADALFTKYSARQKGLTHGGEEGPGPKAPKRSGRPGRGANTDRGSGNAADRKRRALNTSYEYDTFDAILEHLVAEGYADTNENALVIMANMSEEWRDGILQQLDEISQQTKMRAFKHRATREFESDGDNPKDFTKSGKSKADITKANIVKKHGEKAGQHAERAAHAGIFGRKSFSMPKKPE